MAINLKNLLNLEIPKDFESVVEAEIEKNLLRLINGLEVAIKGDIRPQQNSKKKVLYQEKHLILYHYEPLQNEIFSVPVLLVPPLMTTTDIFDLLPQHSLANELAENGFNVYMLDFGKPDKNDSHIKIDDYVLNFLYRAVHMIKKHSSSDKVSLLGYCLGGTFSILYSSVSLDARNDVKNVINIAGPVDVSSLPFFNMIFKYFKKEWFNLANKHGGVPKELLTFIFKISDPVGYFRRPLHLLNKAWDRDSLVKYQALSNFFSNFQHLPAATFKQAYEIICSNALVTGKLKLMDQTVSVDLSNCRASLLVFAGSRDTFIPADSVRAIQKHISSKDFQYVELPFGHVSIMGSERVKDTIWKTCVDWLKTRSGNLVVHELKDTVKWQMDHAEIHKMMKD